MRSTEKTLLRVGLCSLPLLAYAGTFSLSDLSWTLRNQNGSIVIPGSLPSQAHIDLFKAGVIGDPLSGINEYTERWIVNENWTYTADLAPFAQYLKGDGKTEKTLLVFYGIDTIANITFSGHPVAWVNNQYRRYTYDVSGYLDSPIEDDLNVTIALESPWYYGLNVTARPDAEEFSGSYPIANFEYPSIREWIRKTGSDFGWDFVGAYMPSGVYKPAYLVTLSDSETLLELPDDPAGPRAKNAILLDETSVDIYKYGQNVSFVDQSADWVVNVTFGIRSVKSFGAPTVTLSFPELSITSLPLALGSIPAGTEETIYLSTNWSIPEGIPERWYPFDLGAPKLYNLTVVLDPSGSGCGMCDSGNYITQTITTGFRTIQLVQSAYSEEEISSLGINPGDRWHFAINDHAFYTKGTSIVPFDPFYSRINPEDVRWLLESAVRSGQNMVRVWGGGIYQPSDRATDGGLYDFYSLCDELGILVWSELAFSDSVYPINSWMLESIEPEVRQNVRRINRHPSLVQWVGGNEIEIIIELFATALPNYMLYLDQFIFLFQNYLHDIVLSETNSVPYTDSSVTKGALSLDPYVLRLLNDTTGIYGDSEYYNYDATQAFNLSSYPITRFMVEFGFHSMPSFYTWQDVLENAEDFAFNSSVVLARVKHLPAGNLTWPNPNAVAGQAQMTGAVEIWLPTPGTSDANQTFAQWCWSTQVFQAMMMANEISWYRRGAGMAENNLGSIVWQLNDAWQGVSWSAIEYSGRWKVLNYALASAYAPVTIRPFWVPENETLTVLVTSDRWECIEGKAQLTWYDWGGKVLNSSTMSFSVPSLNNSLIYEGTGLDTIVPPGYKAADVWLLMNLTAQVGGRTMMDEAYFNPVPLANASIVDPKIVVDAGNDYTFTLSALGGVGAWTWLDHPYGTIGFFMDTKTGKPSNGFYLVPGMDRTVQFVQNAQLSAIQSPDLSDFVVRSLWNNTHV